MKEKVPYFLYVLELSNGALYTGVTRDVVVRFLEHRRGAAARCTRSFPPVRIAGCWKVPGGRGAAMSVEAFFKNRRRAAKLRFLSEPKMLSRAYLEHARRSGRPQVRGVFPAAVPEVSPEPEQLGPAMHLP